MSKQTRWQTHLRVSSVQGKSDHKKIFTLACVSVVYFPLKISILDLLIMKYFIGDVISFP